MYIQQSFTNFSTIIRFTKYYYHWWISRRTSKKSFRYQISIISSQSSYLFRSCPEALKSRYVFNLSPVIQGGNLSKDGRYNERKGESYPKCFSLKLNLPKGISTVTLVDFLAEGFFIMASINLIVKSKAMKSIVNSYCAYIKEMIMCAYWVMNYISLY